MTIDLPPYDEKARCLKCGYSEVATRYHFTRDQPGCDALPVTLAEHLCRTCGRCGYRWQEAVVAAQPADDPCRVCGCTGHSCFADCDCCPEHAQETP